MFLLLFMFLVRYEAECLSDYYVIQMPVDDPPNNRIPLNNPPMQVYWNVPTMQCTSKKILFRNLYEKFGIIQNKGDSFRGDRIAILYDPGMFPAIFKNDSSGRLKFRNGGVPQEGDLAKHLESFSNILNQSIPDENFDGVGIIDFESWRPVYRQNFGELSPYKDVSYEIERDNHWWWPSAMVTAEAKRRFEVSACTFMAKTLVEAKKMRPLARWGYYAYPYCFNSKNDKCADKVLAENDYISWLWAESTALYPSVYSSKELTSSQLSQLVKGRVKEADRAKRAHGSKSAPILPYFWYKYRDGGYMKEEDLETVLKTFDNSEASGFIIWGSSNDVNTLEKCVKLSNYVEKVLGPAISKYTKRKISSNDVGIQNVVTTEINLVNTSVINVDDNRNISFSNESIEGNVTDIKGDNNSSSVVMNIEEGENSDVAHENNSEIYIVDNKENTTNKTVIEDDKNTTTVNPESSKSNQNNITDNKSHFSLYSVPNALIIEKLGEKYGLTTTELPELNIYTTEVLNFSTEFESLDPEYHWDPPENDTQDMMKYVKEEFVEKSQAKYNKSDNEEIKIFKEYSDNQTLIDIILGAIFQYKKVVSGSSANKKEIGEDMVTEKRKYVTLSTEEVQNKTTIINGDLSEIKSLCQGQETVAQIEKEESNIESQLMNIEKELINTFTNTTETFDMKPDSTTAHFKINQTDNLDISSFPSSKERNDTENNDAMNKPDINSTTELVVENNDQVENENIMRDVYTTEYTTMSSDFATVVIKREVDEKNKVKIYDESIENTTLTTTDNYSEVTVSHLSDTNNAEGTFEKKIAHNHNLISLENNEKTHNITVSSETLEDSNETDESKSHGMHDMKKKHHNKHKKKGSAGCHHHMSEKEETTTSPSTTTRTTKKPDKRPPSLKELIIPKVFQDVPRSEEFISPDFSDDQVLVSLV